jgi:hypothetical protein
MNDWPKKPYSWIVDRILHISIPFTWNLPGIRSMLQQRSFFWDCAVIGGPAIELLPDFFDDIEYVTIGHSYSGVLQKINPLATRTTTGCIRHCKYCAIGTGKVESGGLKCLDDWPDLPLICDNNLLAAPIEHFDKVVNRLKKHDGVDFNQGLDSRLLTDYHANRIKEISGLKKRGIRLALDDMIYSDIWGTAVEKLKHAGIAKRNISSYALIGFNSDPSEAWARCEWIEKQGPMVLPMWFHKLDQLERNIITPEQESLGWNDYERRKIMQWFYHHKRAVV